MAVTSKHMPPGSVWNGKIASINKNARAEYEKMADRHGVDSRAFADWLDGCDVASRAKLAEIRARLLLRSNMVPAYAFYVAVMLQLKARRWDYADAVAGVTHSELWYCPVSFSLLSSEKITAVLLHEAEHIIRITHDRAEQIGASETDWYLTNIAHDAVINTDLCQTYDNVPDVDTEWLSDTGVTMNGLIARGHIPKDTPPTLEDVYYALKSKASEFADLLKASGADGDVLPGGEGGEVGAKAAENILRKAAHIATNINPGSVPGEVKKRLDYLSKPKINWRDVLSTTMSAAMDASDWSLRRPDAGYLYYGVLAPGMIQDNAGAIAIAVDTSGSVLFRDAYLQAFVSELVEIISRLRPSRCYVICADSAVRSVVEYGAGEAITIDDLDLTGGGGTSFDPPFDYIRDEGLSVDTIVYFTDAEGSVSESSDPGKPVVWCVPTGAEAFPFGVNVEIDVDEE